MIELTIKTPAVHKECFKPELKENKTPKQTISASILHVTLNSIIVSIATNVDCLKGKKQRNWKWQRTAKTGTYIFQTAHVGWRKEVTWWHRMLWGFCIWRQCQRYEHIKLRTVSSSKSLTAVSLDVFLHLVEGRGEQKGWKIPARITKTEQVPLSLI